MTSDTKPRHPIALIVDDEATIRLIAAQALQIAGFQVEEAEDGPAALAAVGRLRPDVILLDARLPGMDGFRVCKAIRALPGGETIPILMVTGMDDDKLREWAKEVGATDIIGKPFNLVALSQRLRTLIQGGAGEERSAC
jgi:DNA-binding response OmpR family regulator